MEIKTIEELPLPRMVNVRGNINHMWEEGELLAILPEDMRNRYICRYEPGSDGFMGFNFMQEKPILKEITHQELAELGYKLKSE